MPTISKQNAMVTTLAAAIAAIGVLGIPAPALADPPCQQWGFAGPTHFAQDNKWQLHFNSTGSSARGDADATHVNGFMVGTIDGEINGYEIDLTVNWRGGSQGKYLGSVDVNGFANGITYDAAHPGASAPWHSVGPLKCMPDDAARIAEAEAHRRAVEEAQRNQAPPAP